MEDMYRRKQLLQELEKLLKTSLNPFLEGAQAEKEVIESLQKRFFNQDDFSKMMTSVYTML